MFFQAGEGVESFFIWRGCGIFFGVDFFLLEQGVQSFFKLDAVKPKLQRNE